MARSPSGLYIPDYVAERVGGQLREDAGRARIVRAFMRLLRHTKGAWAGQPFEPEPWQWQDVLGPLLTTVGPDGLRWYREGLIGLPRKNGKSTVCSALGLILLTADGEAGAEVYSAAGDKDQARIVFRQAQEMVRASPVLSRAFKVYRDVIEFPETASTYRVLSADAPLKHGLNPHGVIIDELHVHRDPELYYALRTAVGARSQPLVVSITTAGWDEESLCYERFQHGRSGTDPRFFFYWREAPRRPDGRPWPVDDFDAWCEANPASWQRTPEAMELALSAGLPEPVTRRLYLNQWTASDEGWIPLDAWDECADVPELEPGSEVVVAVDVAPKRDTTAVVLVHANEDGRLDVLARVFTADEDTGYLDFEAVEDYIRELAHEFYLAELVFDPYNFTRSALMLADEGVAGEVVEFPQTDSRMVPASQALYDAITGRRLRHGGDSTLRAQAEAAAAKETGRGWRIVKRKATRSIDSVVALAMAVSRVADNEGGEPTVMVSGSA